MLGQPADWRAFGVVVSKLGLQVHESFQKDDPARFTRGDFGWGDALLVELESESPS